MKTFIEIFDVKFEKIYKASRHLVEKVSAEKLYWQPRETNALFPVNSFGEYILRSTAAVEQTFGGITTKLWDDPFEWTLPEQLSTKQLILEYLEEVEATRKKGFRFFTSDEDLKKQIPAPEELKTLFEILLETVARAEYFQGRGAAIFQIISDKKLLKF
jgi:hypothetical protein